VFIIGIDPHKGSHTAAALDRSETVIGELRVSADRRQRDRLLEFAADLAPRRWAIESASGLGALLAQQLVAAGETILDIPPTLSARVRLLDAGSTDKTDPHDARAAAIVTLRHTRLRRVAPGRSHRGAASAGRPAPRPHRAAHPGDLSAARPVVRPHPWRCQPAAVRPASRPDPAHGPPGEPCRGRTHAHRGRSARRRPPLRQPARRALKRQIAKAVYRHLVTDAHR
jgi:Transposase